MSLCPQSSRQIPGRLSWAWEPRFTPTLGPCYVLSEYQIFSFIYYYQNRIITWPIYFVYSISNTQTANLIILARAFSYFSSSLLVMPHYISFLLSSWSFHIPDCRIKLFTDLLTMYVVPSPFFVAFPLLEYYHEQPNTRAFTSSHAYAHAPEYIHIRSWHS